MLLLAEKVPRSKSSAVNDAGMLVSRLRSGGGLCQSNEVGVEAIRLWSMDSMPCMGAFTCAASCDSKCFIRPSNASRCSDATTSRGFCVLTHCSVKRLHVEHGVSPSHLILRRRHRSHALDTDFRRGCQSLTAVTEKEAGASPAGNVVKGHMSSLGVEDSAPDGDDSGLAVRNGQWMHDYRKTGS